jgi:hypothetical protein
MEAMGVDDSLIAEIVRRHGEDDARQRHRPARIRTQPGNTRDESVRLLRALRGLGYPLFDESKGVFGGLAYPAHKNGRVIYECC